MRVETQGTRVRIYAEREFLEEACTAACYLPDAIGADDTSDCIEANEIYGANLGSYKDRLYFIDLSIDAARYLLGSLPHYTDVWGNRDQSEWTNDDGTKVKQGHVVRSGHALKDLLTEHGLTPKSGTMGTWIGSDAAGPLALVAIDEYERWRSGWPENKTEFTVTLKDFGENKINVIKAIREVTDWGLKEAKEFVESAPASVKEGLSKEEAYWTKATLEGAGATVEIT